MTETASRLLRGFTVFTAGSALGAVCFYAYRVFLARVLQPEQYGLIFAVWALFSFVMPFRSLGFASAFVRFVPRFMQEGSAWKVKTAAIQLFVVQFATASMLAIAVFLFQDVLATSYFRSSEAGLLLIAFLPFFFISVVGDTAEMMLYAFDRIGLFTVKRFLDQALLLLFAVGLFSLFPDTRIAAVAMGCAAVLTSGASLWMAVRALPQVFQSGWWWDRGVFREILRFGLPQMFANSGLAIFTYLDMLLLTYFRGLTDVALYAIAQPIALLLMYFRKPLVVAFNPLASELAINDKRKLASVVEHVQRWMFIAIGGGGTILFFIATDVVSIAFGEEYRAAGRIVQLLILGVPFTAVSLVDMRALFAIGSATLNARVSLFTGVATTVLNLALIPLFGIIGAAIASVVSGILSFSLTSYHLKRLLKVDVPSRTLVKTTCAVLIAGGVGVVVSLVPVSAWFIRVPLLASTIGATYLLSAIVMDLFTVQELVQHVKRLCALRKR